MWLETLPHIQGVCHSTYYAYTVLPTIQGFPGLSRDFRCDPGIATKFVTYCFKCVMSS